MLSDISKLNYILFQLIKFDTEKKTATELLVTSLAVFPRNITYQYTSRSAIAQTRGENEVDGFRESYGRGLTRVIISGTFGSRSRLSGTKWKSGWTRLLEFRELVFKLSNIQRGQTKRRIAGVNTAIYEKEFLKDNEVIAVNFFDFHNNEKFAINLDQFQIIEDASQNNLPNYTLIATEIGDYIYTKTSDPTLLVLLGAENILGEIITKADELIGKIEQNETIYSLSGAFTSANVALSAIGAGLTGTASLLNLADQLKDVFQGKTLNQSISNFKSIF